MHTSLWRCCCPCRITWRMHHQSLFFTFPSLPVTWVFLSLSLSPFFFQLHFFHVTECVYTKCTPGGGSLHNEFSLMDCEFHPHPSTSFTHFSFTSWLVFRYALGSEKRERERERERRRKREREKERKGSKKGRKTVAWVSEWATGLKDDGRQADQIKTMSLMTRRPRERSRVKNPWQEEEAE